MATKRQPNRSRIAEEYRDSDGYWIYLAPGWRMNDDAVHGIIENTKREAYDRLRDVVPCDCAECVGLIAAAKASA